MWSVHTNCNDMNDLVKDLLQILPTTINIENTGEMIMIICGFD